MKIKTEENKYFFVNQKAEEPFTVKDLKKFLEKVPDDVSLHFVDFEPVVSLIYSKEERKLFISDETGEEVCDA